MSKTAAGEPLPARLAAAWSEAVQQTIKIGQRGSPLPEGERSAIEFDEATLLLLDDDRDGRLPTLFGVIRPRFAPKQ